MTTNPYFDFLTKAADKITKTLLVWDVDLAIQNSMDTRTTQEQRDHMWELFERTDGGVLIMTGRTHQSAETTFGKQYAGVYEHGSIARYGHGHAITWLAQEIDTTDMGARAFDGIQKEGSIRIVATPQEIRDHSYEGSQERAVFIEIKNASVALVHTTNGNHSHLNSMREVLEPLGEQILKDMGLSETHKIKHGSDAVEILPKGPSPDHKAGIYLQKAELERIAAHGLSKETAVHNFQTLFEDRRMLFTGDSKPDIDAMIVAHQNYDGKGVFVSNGHSLSDIYAKGEEEIKAGIAQGKKLSDIHAEVAAKVEMANGAIAHTTEKYTMTWPLIADTVVRLRNMAPITKITPANTTDVLGKPKPPTI